MNSLKTNPIYIINDSYTTIQITTLQYILVLEFSIDRVTTIPRDCRQKRAKILTKSIKSHMPNFILSISIVYNLWLVLSFVLNYVVVILDSMICTYLCPLICIFHTRVCWLFRELSKIVYIDMAFDFDY